MTETRDVAVVGGGAAGLSAALVLSRARRTVTVVDAGEPRNAPAAHMHNYLGRDGTPPGEFLAIGRKEAESYGARIVDARVTGIERNGADGAFRLLLDDGAELWARRIILATGLRDELADIPGLREGWGDYVLHCPYCHGYEVRDRPIGVLGTGPHAVRLALMLKKWSADLVYFPHGQEVTGEDRLRLEARGVQVVEGGIRGLVAGGAGLTGVELDSGAVVPREAVFAPSTMRPSGELLDGLGCARDADGSAATDPMGRTSVPGVWAAGVVVDPMAQVIAAAAMGSRAASAVDHDLIEEEVEQAVSEYRR
ncbi:NAD(P)/FAD-dependent oxidoreductase [Nocardiopsis sp. RSe5-2]|uniref:NAD(P)/FAD-dependent oxidoreductase n=1 Tax=Nocardiopsis endophytica TaxID=3018445 RepID=A0ABT4TWJ7_9ACTN|nr:NAD(P)/FAD-dependent oxidoreductase [Nocardiopsis endophytica]MDA2809084.1 NAD(P)/FAD-dependent oxidoreductase [Nocardiopsis endophytica]